MTGGRPRTQATEKLTAALTRGRGVTLPHRDVVALVETDERLTYSQINSLKTFAQEWQQYAADAPSWTAAAAYNDAAHTLAHWIETQQGVGE